MSTEDGELEELFATLVKCDSWRFQRQYFPSKAGGKPAWLNPAKLPDEDSFKCENCSTVMSFLLQIYAPDELVSSEDAFHRTIFVFVCQSCKSFFKALRCQLPRRNCYYSFDPEEEGKWFPESDGNILEHCCYMCGIPCRDRFDVEDLDLFNKLNVQPAVKVSVEGEALLLHPRCKIALQYDTILIQLDERLLDICQGDLATRNQLSHEHDLYRRYCQQNIEDEDDISESEEKAIEELQSENVLRDILFKKFCKSTNSKEVIYYCRGGEPLWTTDWGQKPQGRQLSCLNHGSDSETSEDEPEAEPGEAYVGGTGVDENDDHESEPQLEPQLEAQFKSQLELGDASDSPQSRPGEVEEMVESTKETKTTEKTMIHIPDCERCGAKRSFEFQVLPQFQFFTQCDRIEFGSVSIYTCSASCHLGGEYAVERIHLESDLSMMPRQRLT